MSEAIEAAYSAAYHRAAKSARRIERQRIAEILALPEARRRFSFAAWIATSTMASVDQARHRLRTENVASTPAQPAMTLVAGMRERFAGAPSPAQLANARPAADMATSGGLAAGMRARFMKGAPNA